jgi:heat shock protein HslJ
MIFLALGIFTSFLSLPAQCQEPGLSQRWKVTYVGRFQNPKSQKRMESLFFEFDESNSTYSGNLGCNLVSGTFTLIGKHGIQLNPGASTLMTCPSMEVELDMENALEKTRTYKIENGTLYLMDASGKTLMMLQAVNQPIL